MRNQLGLMLAAGLVVSLAAPAAAQTTTTVTHTRVIEAYYGTGRTVDSDGNLLSTQDFLELTDHVSGNPAGAIFNDANVDARVKNNLGAWVNAQADIEWVLGTPEGLPADANLFNDLTNIPGRRYSETDTGTMDRGAATYNLVNWTTQEGSGGSITFVDHIGNAEVHYHERNYTKVVSAPLAPAAAQTTTTVTHTRVIEAYYGTGRTVDSDGNLLSTQDFLELTDHVSFSVANGIAGDANVDARVKSSLALWVNAQADIEWVLGAPEGLPAGANLFNDLTNIPGRRYSETDTGAMDRGMATYTIASWTTTEGTGQLDHTGNAEVHYYERNYTKVVSAPLVLSAKWLQGPAREVPGTQLRNCGLQGRQVHAGI